MIQSCRGALRHYTDSAGLKVPVERRRSKGILP